MDIKEKIKQINWRQPKFMLPAILYIPLMGGSYFIFDLFHAEKAEIPDKTLQTTEFLNPELPDAQIKDGDGIGSKYENMAKSWGKIQDYSAVDNIDRDEPDENKLNPEKPDVPLNKNDAFQKVQKRRVQEKR